MNEPSPSFEQQELSSDDLAVLQAFTAKELWQEEHTYLPETSAMAASATRQQTDDDEMLAIFIAEAAEDIHKMQQTLLHWKRDEQSYRTHFVTLQRAGHKLRGTAGAVNFPTMSVISHHVEIIAEQIMQGTLAPAVGVEALSQTITVLEYSLQNLREFGQALEDLELITELEALYQSLGIHLSTETQATHQKNKPLLAAGAQALETGELDNSVTITAEEEMIAVRIPSQRLHDNSTTTPFMRVDARRFAKLEQHTEPLIEQSAQLEHAQKQVDKALQELQTAQAHLQQLEQELSILQLNDPHPALEQQPSSSLVARILHEAGMQNDTQSPHRFKLRQHLTLRASKPAWDELEIERFSAKSLLIHSLREAIAAVTTAAAQVNTAYMQLHVLQRAYMARISLVRNDTLLLRLAPLSILVPRLQRVVAMSALAQEQAVEFEVSGETTEVDQDILESLSMPLLQLLRSCISDPFTTENELQGPCRIWLNASSVGNEISIEVGFSMMVHGGTVNVIREPIQRINGTISLQRNTTGGISFWLHFPRSHGAARYLLVRASDQCLLVPFSQVQRIGERKREKLDVLYHLSKLLDFPVISGAKHYSQLVLVLPTLNAQMTIGVIVDEVIDEIELVVKPLPPYLRRPGIGGSGVDGKGNVLLMLDLPELVSCYTHNGQHTAQKSDISDEQLENGQAARKEQTTVLIADDSAYLRHSLSQVLEHAHYNVIEASDGLQALELLQKTTPELCLLDIEMPNLDGYDVLNMIRYSPQLAHMKVVMLTSRNSEKHVQRAFALGASDYLTKPCPQERLLETLQKLLTH